ncbi:alpha/beta hydrolase [Massilia sp. ST3]|uniref:alpha/beta hydrolase n=1 Tax=Massilia sp. ST3 TaxID=2824903 RepID=UPI001B83B1BB|nr:alpha/beta fold hydrolase [Massilia sp. ST3]MBQ5949439.1 alpha/beta fold hydrolase [Massilia sp. ST3]
MHPVFRAALLRAALPLLVAAGSAGAAAPESSTPASPPAAARSCHLPGSVDALRCVSVSVPLDYAEPRAGTLKLHVTVAPAFRQGTRGDPLFVLAGGPGQAGTDVLGMLNTAFHRVRATRDIVFIDQRGTGLSGKLDCKSKPEHERMSEQELEAELRACITGTKARYAAYTTAASARDIEQVRRALGYRQVNLWGGSYGTRLGQAYTRAYPASVRSLVLDGVAAPDQVIPAGARDAQAALEAVFAQCARDAACNKAFPALRDEFNALVARLERGGIPLSLPDPRTAQPVSFTLTAGRFLGTVHNILYAPADARRLPFLIHSASQGRWGPFIARQNLSSDFGLDADMSMLLYLAVVCAEDVPRMTPALLAQDTGQLTKTLADQIPGMCRTMTGPAAAAPAPAPARIDAPALLLSGALDPVTPPHRAASAAKFMPRAQQVVVANAGHGVSQLGCAPRLLREFLDRPQARLDAACMAEIPAPTFQLGSAGPQP